MPEEGVPLTPDSKLLSTPEILHIANLFVSQGVTKIRLTGGEPTIRKDIIELVTELGKLKSKGLKELAITSNGIVLARKLDKMVQGGLTAVNLSLDTLEPWKFEVMTRRKGLESVLKTIDKALELDVQPLKVNCVVMRGVNDYEIPKFVEMTREKPVEVRFIEYMPFDVCPPPLSFSSPFLPGRANRGTNGTKTKWSRSPPCSPKSNPSTPP